jgi:hypothetical protein
MENLKECYFLVLEENEMSHDLEFSSGHNAEDAEKKYRKLYEIDEEVDLILYNLSQSQYNILSKTEDDNGYNEDVFFETLEQVMEK